MMQTLIVMIVWALCALVVVASICRLSLLRKGRHKISWALMYLLFGAFALDTALSAVELLIEHDAHTFLGLLALALNVIITQKSWRNGAPRVSEKE